MNVWVTREEPADGPLCSALREVGLVPVLEPVIGRRVVDDARDEIARLGPDDWLVLTSLFAIEAVPADVASVPRVAVVGEPSRRVAAERGLRVELVGNGGGAALFRELVDHAMGTTVLYPRSSLAKVPELPASIELRSPVLYETAACDFRRSVIDEVDVITVASPSAVRAIGRVALPFASIGPTTTAALVELGLEPAVQATEPTFVDLARAVAAYGLQ